MSGSATTGLYIISPSFVDGEKFFSSLEEALSTGLVDAYQLRLKDCDTKTLLDTATRAAALCQRYQVSFIMNDYPAVAIECGADGVHMGQDDLANIPGGCRSIREKLGEDKIIGVSCYNSLDLAIQAAEDGASYVAFGAFYPTKTKPNAKQATIDLLSWWHSNATIPCVAIGGITPERSKDLILHGADIIAVVSAIWEDPEGPKAAVEAFNAVFAIAESQNA